MKRNLITSFTICCLIIVGCGTSGGFDDRQFALPKEKLRVAIDSVYIQDPKYKIPTKWKEFDNWSQRGFSFLESRIFYFREPPEEMYYVAFVNYSGADTTKSIIAIRAVFQEHGKNIWLSKGDLRSKEADRIQKRFDSEIVSKLERYTKSKVVQLDD